MIYDYFCRSGETFQDHIADGVQGGVNAAYPLPETASEAYRPAGLVLNGKFEKGDYTYTVIGYRAAELTAYRGSRREITLFETSAYGGREYAVESLGMAFENNLTIEKINLPKSLSVIQAFAFYGCTNLKEAVFAETAGWTRQGRSKSEEIPADKLTPSEAAALLKEFEAAQIGGQSGYYGFVWTR